LASSSSSASSSLASPMSTSPSSSSDAVVSSSVVSSSSSSARVERRRFLGEVPLGRRRFRGSLTGLVVPAARRYFQSASAKLVTQTVPDLQFVLSQSTCVRKTSPMPERLRSGKCAAPSWTERPRMVGWRRCRLASEPCQDTSSGSTAPGAHGCG
jgi:hypothetical protein